MKKILILFLCLLILPAGVNANEKEFKLAESAKSVMLMEATTGEIIYENNADEQLNPASMTKMMSMLLIMEAIENGSLTWNQEIQVSENASRMGGSQILLETGEKMTVRDLLKGVAIASGNDAVVALAEATAGTEEAFVDMMNKKAKKLGLKNTNFKTSHGLDEANHYSSARDMALIARELVVKYPKILEFTSVYEDYLRENTDKKIWLVNTNKLVRFYDGVDGLKTGYTEEAGFCLTATAEKEGMRIIAVVMGEPDSKTRNSDVSSMLDYAFAQYKIDNLLDGKDSIGKYAVAKGKKRTVNVVPKNKVTILRKKSEKSGNATYEVEMKALNAPLKKGSTVGTLRIKEGGNIIRTIKLTVDKDVKKANILELYLQYLEDIFTGNVGIK